MRKIILILTLIAFASCSEKECCVQNACMLEPETGSCRASIVKYYYDKQEKQCREFIWGGCKGVVPFHTLEECKACEEISGSSVLSIHNNFIIFRYGLLLSKDLSLERFIISGVEWFTNSGIMLLNGKKIQAGR